MGIRSKIGRSIAVIATTLLLPLFGCSDTASPSQPTQAEDVTAEESLQAAQALSTTTEPKTIPVLTSWTLETPNHYSTQTYSYDISGNLMEETIDMIDYGTHAVTRKTYTYDEQTNEPVLLNQEMRTPENVTTSEYSCKSILIPQPNGQDDIVFTFTPHESSDEYSYSIEERYTVDDNLQALTNYVCTYISLAGQTSDNVVATDENSTKTAYVYNEDNTLSSLTTSALGEDEVIDFSYQGDVVSDSDEATGPWVISKNDAGLMVEVVNESNRTKATFTYEYLDGFTDFNRALAAKRPADAFANTYLATEPYSTDGDAE